MRYYRNYLNKKPLSPANDAQKSLDSATDQVSYLQPTQKPGAFRPKKSENKRKIKRWTGPGERKDCFGDDYTDAWVLIRPLSVVNEAWTREEYINIVDGAMPPVFGSKWSGCRLSAEWPLATS